MEHWTQVLGVTVSVLTLLGVIFNFSVIKPLNDVVRGLRESVDCLRRQLYDTEAKRQEMAERLSKVEESTSHAHHRLDVLETRQNQDGQS